MVLKKVILVAALGLISACGSKNTECMDISGTWVQGKNETVLEQTGCEKLTVTEGDKKSSISTSGIEGDVTLTGGKGTLTGRAEFTKDGVFLVSRISDNEDPKGRAVTTRMKLTVVGDELVYSVDSVAFEGDFTESEMDKTRKAAAKVSVKATRKKS